MSIDRRAAENAIRTFLLALGHDPDTHPELSRTPALVVEAFESDLLSGYAVNIPALLASESSPLPEGGPSGPVILRDVDVTTVCPHHLLPSTGHATVAYLPGRKLIGLGTLARVVDGFARRLTLQESIGDAVVRALMDGAGARGAYCRLALRHACVTARGVRQPRAVAITVATSGEAIPGIAAHEAGEP